MSTYDDFLLNKWVNAGDWELCAHDDAALAIPTSPTGDSDSVTHPAVVHFPSGWNGYDYWMAMTPLAAVVDENPEIVASDDGLSWEVPVGLTNPIDLNPGLPAHNSDTELFYDSVADELWCYYREINASTGATNIQLRTSSDGITWSAESTVISSASNDHYCPTVDKVGSTYYMWLVDNARGVFRYQSTDGSTWTTPTACTGLDINAWNIHVRYDSGTSKYYMMVNDNAINGVIYWLESSDGLAWTQPKRRMILQRGGMWPEVTSGEPWDHDSLYKASFVIISGTVHIWYSGNFNGQWGIGYTSIALSALS